MFADVGSDCVGFRLIRNVAERHVGAFAGETFDDGASNTLITSCDRCDFSFEAVWHSSFSFWWIRNSERRGKTPVRAQSAENLN
jgi:hypothetical protein